MNSSSSTAPVRNSTFRRPVLYSDYFLKPITIFECSTSKGMYFEAKDEAYQKKYHPNEKTFQAIEI